jgi:M6 family metalloprotease-like protein
MNRIVFSFVLAVSMFTLAHAAYVSRMPVEVQQPDGTTVRCLATGDEYHNWLHDENDFTIIQDHTNGWYVYATLKAGQLRPTTLRPGRDDPASAGLTSGVNIPPEQWQQRRTTLLSVPGPSPAATPTTGTINNIVFFIRFKGETEFARQTSTYNTLFNSASSGANSMYNYFREVSYNKLSVFTSFYPTATGSTVLSYQDTQPRGYYRVYDATTNPIGYSTDAERTSREHGLLDRCVVAVRSQIPASLTIDADGDGYVDNVCFIVSGSSDAWASLLWPHMWALYTTTTMINGKRVYSFNFQLETFIDQRGNGVLCHEMLHTLGAPDLYRYNVAGTPVGPWDVMAQDANPPQHPSAFLKYKYLHWITTIPQITTTGKYALSPLTSADNNCYKFASPNSTSEYFMAEYRRRTGTFESSLPGEGLIVYRINPAASGNASGPPDEVYVYRPNGTPSATGLITSAHFSSVAGRTVFSDSTNPASFLASGGEGGATLSEIGYPGNTISFNYEKPGIVGASASTLVMNQQGSLSVQIVAPRSAEYMIEIRNAAGSGTPPWSWSPISSQPVYVNAGRHQTFVHAVTPSTATETFRVIMHKRENGGAWAMWDFMQAPLTATTGGPGSVRVTVSDAEGWPGPGTNATVKLLNPQGVQIAAVQTNSAGTATFSSIAPGTGYSYLVFYQGLALFDKQYWGRRDGITVAAGVTTDYAFTRNAPYAPAIRVYIDSTNAEVTEDTVRPGTRLRVELTVKNPAYTGAVTSITKARLIADRDRTAPFDFEQVSGYQTYAVGQIRTVAFTITPQREGFYEYAEELLSDIGGFETTTEASFWGNLVWVLSDGPGAGELKVTVSDAETWGLPGIGATVNLYTKTGTKLALQRTDAQSVSLFTGVPSDTGYSYHVNFQSTTERTPFGEQYWGARAGVKITRGQTFAETFTRNLPYAPAMTLFDSTGRVDITGTTVKAPVTLRMDLTLKNPAYTGAVTRTTRGRIIMDRNREEPYDYDILTPWTTLAPGESRVMTVYIQPQDSATVFAAGGVVTDLSGTSTVTDGGSWSSNPVITVTQPDRPAIPQLLSPLPFATAVPLPVQMRWKTAARGMLYHLQVASDTLFTGFMHNDSTLTDTTRTTMALARGTRYFWRVRAKGTALLSPWSTPWEFTTMPMAPLAPVLQWPVQDSALATPQALLVWYRTAGAARYQLQVAADPEFSGFVMSDTSLTDTTRTIPLVTGTTYYWRVRAFNDGGWGEYSSTRSFKAIHATPQLASPAGGTTGTATALSLLWHPIGGATRYHVQASTHAVFDSAFVVNDSTVADTSYNVTGLARNTQYHWRVRAGSVGTFGMFSGASWFRTAQVLPSKPELMYPDNGGAAASHIVAFIWSTSTPDVVRYAHQISTDSLFVFASTDTSITDTTHIITSLPNGTYWWRVRANNSAGWGEYSEKHRLRVTATGIDAAAGIPQAFSLAQNYPNPFNPTTMIRFGLPSAAEVHLAVYNALGQEVRNLAEGVMEAGYHVVQFDASGLPSGMYFYRMRAGTFVETKRLAVIK